MQHAVRSDARAPASALHAHGSAGAARACRLRRLERPGRRHGGAAAARGHRRQAAGAEADRVGRVHRPVRGGAAGRDPGPGLGLPAGDRLPGRPDRRGRPGAVRHRPAALSGGASTAPRRRSSSASARSSTLAQLDQRPRQQAGQHLGRRPGDPRPAQLQELAEAAAASLAAAQAAAARRPSSISTSPRSRRRSPAASPTAGSTSATWSPTQTLLTTIVRSTRSISSST